MDKKIKQILDNKDLEASRQLLLDEKGFLEVLRLGSQKPGRDGLNWLRPDGDACHPKDMYGSIFRHAAECYAAAIKGETAMDELGTQSLQNLHCRVLMCLIRDKYGIIHPDIKKGDKEND